MEGVLKAAKFYVRTGKPLLILLVSSVYKILGPVRLCKKIFRCVGWSMHGAG